MNTKSKYPTIIYKYRNWTCEYHKNVLYKNELFFTSPKDFNDPFDCRIPVNFALLNSKEKITAFEKRTIKESVTTAITDIETEVSR